MRKEGTKSHILPFLFLFLSCGYELRNFKRIDGSQEPLKLMVINRTSEPELEIIMKNESVEVFERGGFKISEDARNSISIYLLSYSAAPSSFFSEKRPAYRASMVIKVIFEKGERKREIKLSQFEEYLKSGILSFDRQNEEFAKNSIVKFLTEETYERFINFLNEKD